MPAVAIVLPEAALLGADDTAFFRVNALALHNPSVINFLDGRALILPIHTAGELPVDLSFCGLANDNIRILRVGRMMEAALRRRSANQNFRHLRSGHVGGFSSQVQKRRAADVPGSIYACVSQNTAAHEV